MNKIFNFLLLLCSAIFFAQDGQIDYSFNPEDGANKKVQTIALESDGKIIIGGNFNLFNNYAKGNIARLNADGSVDQSFIANFDNPNYNDINIIKIQPNGKILIGGYFSKFNGKIKKNFVRINQDGSIDPTFNSDAGFDNAVNSIALQDDGKILVGGAFNNFSNFPINHIVRLNSDGTIDNSFDPGSGPGPGASVSVLAIAIQNDGKIIIGGEFNTYNGVYTQKLVRLNTDGSLDNSFLNAAEGDIKTIAIQKNGKILIGGDFLGYNGMNINFFARLNSDGNIDTSFLGGVDLTVRDIKIQPDSKIVIGGNFTYYNGGFVRRGIARILQDGNLDQSFDPAESIGFGNGKSIRTIELQPNGKIIIGGDFNNFKSVGRNNIARLNNNFLNAIDLVRNEDLYLFPNPAFDKVFIENIDKSTGEIQIDIFDIAGKLVSTQIINSPVKSYVTVKGFLPGMYLVKITQGKKTQSKKLIVK